MERPIDYALAIRDLARRHNALFRDSIPLIASENIMSPLAMEMLLTDFGFRYAEGLPHHRYYQGNFFVDQVEDMVTELAKKVFGSKQADPRPISGTNANTSVLYGLTQPGDTITTPPLEGGGHISAARFGAVGLRGLNPVNYPFDVEEMNIDIDGTAKLLRETRPKLVLFGQSVFLFPTPLRELRDVFEEIGCTVWYDGAHVLGLIAGKQFQDPLREGAHIVTGSTHKTLPGPQHGIILGNADEEVWKAVQRGVFPGTLSNHHLNAMAALGVTLAEAMEFGEKYAAQVVKNARAMAEELASLGMKVLGEKNGYTRSHTLVVDVREYGGGRKVAELLEQRNIILNKNMLPWDDSRKSQNPSGLRIGSQEVTRIGFSEDDCREVARLIHRAVVKGEEKEKIIQEVRELKDAHREVKYCFGRLEAYRYFEIADLGDSGH